MAVWVWEVPISGSTPPLTSQNNVTCFAPRYLFGLDADTSKEFIMSNLSNNNNNATAINSSLSSAALTIVNTGGHAVTQGLGLLSGAAKVTAALINHADADTIIGRARDRSYSDAYTTGQTQGATFVLDTFVSDEVVL